MGFNVVERDYDIDKPNWWLYPRLVVPSRLVPAACNPRQCKGAGLLDLNLPFVVYELMVRYKKLSI